MQNLKLVQVESPLDVYQLYFPDFHPSPFQMDMIESCIADLTMWHEVLEMWAGNGYRPASIKKMIDCYDEKMSKNVRPNRPTGRQMIAEIDRQERG